MKKNIDLTRYFLVVLICLFTYFILFLLIKPLGDFLLCDERMFMKVVKNLMETGRVQLVDIMPMTFVGQAFLGMLFCLPFGFSISILRFLGILLSFIGALSFYGILNELNYNRKLIFLGISVFIFNPLYLLLSFSFMTDIPFLALFLLAVFFYIKGIKLNSTHFLLWGSVFISFTVLIRQTGIILALAVFFFFILFNRKSFSTHKFIVLAIPILVLGVFYYWYFSIHGPTPLYKMHQDFIINSLLNGWKDIPSIWNNLLDNLVRLGFLIFPLAIISIISIVKAKKYSINFLIAAGGIIVTMAFCTQEKGVCDFIWFYNFGLGPVIWFIPGADGHFSINNMFFWYLVILFSTAGAVLILLLIVKALKMLFLRSASLESKFLFLIFISVLGFLTYVWFTSDRYRYLLMVVPFTILLVVENVKDLKINTGLYIFLLVPMILFSTAATQDYISWHRSALEGVKYLCAKRIPLREINCGVELAEWHFYDMKRLENYPYSEYIESYFTNGMVGDRYVVSMSPYQGYTIMKRIEYKTFLRKLGEKKWIYVLRKKWIEKKGKLPT